MIVSELVSAFGSLVKEAMTRVTSADAAYRYLREIGVDITRAVVRDVWREVGQKEYWTTVLETWGHEKTPPKHWVVEQEMREAKGLMHIITASGYSEITDRYEEFQVSRVYDKLMPFDEIYEDLETTVEEYAELLGISLFTVRWGGIVNFVPKR